MFSILLQNKGNNGLGSALGGGSSSGGGGGNFHTQRGLEKFLANTSIFLSILFILIGIANVITLN